MVRLHWTAISAIFAAWAAITGCDTDDDDTESNGNGNNNGTEMDASSTEDASDGEGLAMCKELAETCHDSTSAQGEECHEFGHELHADECRAHYEECIAICTSDAGEQYEDGGHTHDGGHHDAGHDGG